MMIREQIEEKLRTAFDPVFLEVVDESYRHNVPAGSESHFKVVLVSARFTGERFLNRHRMIYGTLTAELSTTVHALALHTYTLKEWEGLQDTIFASPPCRGAGSIA
ncbi:transcriptional regulator BolA [Salmonella enterica]|nr:transcriptional regulator BolA [Salmonella enterica]ELF9700350.1 transcriptional regulator BolA [Salmonella enterica]